MMDPIIWLLLVLLLLLCGVLGMGEVAVVACSKMRLRKLAADGDDRARLILEMSAVTQRFLSAMLVGITVLTLAAGLVAGLGIGQPLALWLAGFAWIPYQFAGIIGFFVALGLTTLLSLALSDFIPQRVAVLNPERVALSLARFLFAAYWICAPVAGLLTSVIDSVLNAFGIKTGKEQRVSDEDIRTLVERGMNTGSIQKAELEMVEGVLALDGLPVTTLMTPRPKIIWLNITDSDEVNWRKIVASGHSHFPVCQDSFDHVLGMVSVKALWANSGIGVHTPLKDLLTPALNVPGGMMGIQLLEQFKKTGRHTALVVDEFGGVQGMVTLIDVMEAIVGDLPAHGPKSQPEAHRREDGSWLIDATMPIVEAKALLDLHDLPHVDAEYQTLGGLIVTQLGRIPRTGDFFDWKRWRFEVVDMDRHRVDKVLTTRLPEIDVE